MPFAKETVGCCKNLKCEVNPFFLLHNFEYSLAMWNLDFELFPLMNKMHIALQDIKILQLALDSSLYQTCRRSVGFYHWAVVKTRSRRTRKEWKLWTLRVSMLIINMHFFSAQIDRKNINSPCETANYATRKHMSFTRSLTGMWRRKSRQVVVSKTFGKDFPL